MIEMAWPRTEQATCWGQMLLGKMDGRLWMVEWPLGWRPGMNWWQR